MKEVAKKALSATLAAVLALGPTLAWAERDDHGSERNRNGSPFLNVPVTGTAENGDALTGVFDIQRFEVVGDQLLAVGVLNGKIGNRPFQRQGVALPVLATSGPDTTGSLGTKLQTRPAAFQQSPARAPGIQLAVTCPVLHLTLGPLDLNLLGLVVHLDQVVLNIDAQSGALLGDLLCAVSGLLNGVGALLDIAALLNQILNILNGVIAGIP